MKYPLKILRKISKPTEAKSFKIVLNAYLTLYHAEYFIGGMFAICVKYMSSEMAEMRLWVGRSCPAA